MHPDRSAKFLRFLLPNLKKHMNGYIIIVGDFNMPFSTLYPQDRKETRVLNEKL